MNALLLDVTQVLGGRILGKRRRSQLGLREPIACLLKRESVSCHFMTSQRAYVHNGPSIKWIMQQKCLRSQIFARKLLWPGIIFIMLSVWMLHSLLLSMLHIIHFISGDTGTWKWMRGLCHVVCCQLKLLMWYLLSQFMFNSSQHFSFTGSKIHQDADDGITVTLATRCCSMV